MKKLKDGQDAIIYPFLISRGVDPQSTIFANSTSVTADGESSDEAEEEAGQHTGLVRIEEDDGDTIVVARGCTKSLKR